MQLNRIVYAILSNERISIYDDYYFHGACVCRCLRPPQRTKRKLAETCSWWLPLLSIGVRSHELVNGRLGRLGRALVRLLFLLLLLLLLLYLLCHFPRLALRGETVVLLLRLFMLVKRRDKEGCHPTRIRPFFHLYNQPRHACPPIITTVTVTMMPQERKQLVTPLQLHCCRRRHRK